jgi:hypothetical protein
MSGFRGFLLRFFVGVVLSEFCVELPTSVLIFERRHGSNGDELARLIILIEAVRACATFFLAYFYTFVFVHAGPSQLKVHMLGPHIPPSESLPKGEMGLMKESSPSGAYRGTKIAPWALGTSN